jgi:hypothetical protein
MIYIISVVNVIGEAMARASVPFGAFALMAKRTFFAL